MAKERREWSRCEACGSRLTEQEIEAGGGEIGLMTDGKPVTLTDGAVIPHEAADLLVDWIRRDLKMAGY